MIDKAHCTGCVDDYYNGTGAQECWSLKKAKLVTRFKIGYWTEPTVPRAFEQVARPSCYRQKGYALYDALPDFVKVEEVIGYTRKRIRARGGR